MYVCGLVIPVPAERMEDYRRWAENGARIFREHGCLEIVESWEDVVPQGRQTDFRKAVAEAEERMHASGVLDGAGEPPFDAGRLILGCFAPLATMGR